MTNHLHMLLLSGVRGLAALMHPLLTGYVGGFNRRYHRVGHLVQNRYKAILCEEDPYFLELLRYIHLNPVRAGIVKTLEDLKRYPWTGHSALMGAMPLRWQAVDDVLGRFGRALSAARASYERFVGDGWNQGHRPDLEGGGLVNSLGGLSGALQARATGEYQAHDVRILGGGDFVESVLKASEKADEERSAMLRSGVTVATVQRMAAQTIGVEASQLQHRDRRRPVAQARALFIYAATEFLGQRSQQLAERLQMSSGALSEARERGRLLSDKYHFLELLRGTAPAASVP